MGRMTARECAAASGLKCKLAYTIKETAQYSGVSIDDLNKAIKTGALAAFSPNFKQRDRYVRPECLDEWVDRVEREGLERTVGER